MPQQKRRSTAGTQQLTKIELKDQGQTRLAERARRTQLQWTSRCQWPWGRVAGPGNFDAYLTLTAGVGQPKLVLAGQKNKMGL
jgi:hypothetical protein